MEWITDRVAAVTGAGERGQGGSLWNERDGSSFSEDGGDGDLTRLAEVPGRVSVRGTVAAEARLHPPVGLVHVQLDVGVVSVPASPATVTQVVTRVTHCVMSTTGV